MLLSSGIGIKSEKERERAKERRDREVLADDNDFCPLLVGCVFIQEVPEFKENRSVGMQAVKEPPTENAYILYKHKNREGTTILVSYS